MHGLFIDLSTYLYSIPDSLRKIKWFGWFKTLLKRQEGEGSLRSFAGFKEIIFADQRLP